MSLHVLDVYIGPLLHQEAGNGGTSMRWVVLRYAQVLSDLHGKKNPGQSHSIAVVIAANFEIKRIRPKLILMSCVGHTLINCGVSVENGSAVSFLRASCRGVSPCSS